MFKLKTLHLLGYLIMLLCNVEIILFECPIELPILLQNNTCALLNCSESDFETKYCQINNTQIKTQWITNIIIIGDLDFRYINFGTFSNGDFVVGTTACPRSNKRMFYGLKNNGRGFFKNNSKETEFYWFQAENEEQSGKKYEAELVIAKLNEGDDKGKEYIVSLSKAETYAELYDFENDELYKMKMISLIGMENQNMRMASLTIYDSDNKYYSLYGFINDSKFLIFKLPFPFINSIEEGLNYVKKEISNEVKGLSVSCFETKNHIIICFYYKNDGKPTIITMDYNFNIKGSFSINILGFYDEKSFIKCIHFINEIGVFSFYDNVSYNTNIYPFIYFKEYNEDNDNKFVNPITGMEQQYIILDHYIFAKSTLMNEITKISDEKICYTATSENHEILYVILLNVINFEQVKIRYYSFPIYELKYFKFLSDMKSYSYNNFVMIASSVCRQSKCDDDHNDPHVSSLIIFSYPNSTDVELEISEYLLNNNEIKIENLEIDLKDYVKIENNIFGLIYFGIKIYNISVYDKIKLYSAKNENEIKNNTILEKDENIQIKFENNNYLKDNVSFVYNYIIIEPDRDIYDEYPNILEDYYGNDTEEYFNSKKTEYIGRTSYFTIYLNNNLNKECDDSNCDLCTTSLPEICITCNSYYYFDINDDGTKIKKCNQSSISDNFLTDKETIINQEYSSVVEISDNFLTDKETIINQEYSSVDEISDNFLTDNETIINQEYSSVVEISDNLYYNFNDIIDGNQSKEIYEYLKGTCLNLECASKNKIITTKNIIYQISTYDAQKNCNITYVSSLDLGDCEDKLRKEYGMSDEDEFIIIKKDLKNGITTYVEYEIYNSKNLHPLSLDICNDTQISINVPVNISDETESLYEKLNKLGYNLFDENDSFYNDICTPYTTEDNSDILLSDRKVDIFKNNGNLTLCQTGCQLNLYNLASKTVKCFCSVKKNNTIESESTDLSNKFDKKDFESNFYNTLKNSNFKVLKCYKLVITLNEIFKNKGRIIMTVLLLIILILIIICIIYEMKKIDFFISSILGNKLHKLMNENNLKRNSSNLLNKNEIRRSLKKKSTKNFQKRKKNKSAPPKKLKNKNKEKNYILNPEKVNKILNIDNYNSSIKQLNNHNDISLKTSKRNFNNHKPTINTKNIGKFNINRKFRKSKTQKPKSIIERKNKKSTKDKQLHYSNRELNSLVYEEALKYDQRSYFQYYISLLLQKHLMLFTFYPSGDYNLYTLKFILFLLSFSLYFSINGLFFSDNTMHKIYQDKGAFNILFQIPQILYSSIISAIINIILKQLSLSDKNIIKIKNEKDYKTALKKSKTSKDCMYIKFIIFFILSILLMSFFWYFISCFCAVFQNTQIILIKDTCLSFGISMIYPFGLNLLPGFFRIPALRAQKKDKINLYNFSLLVALL